VLRATDLPQIAASIAPRPITIAALSDPTLASQYASPNVKLVHTPGWTPAAFGV